MKKLILCILPLLGAGCLNFGDDIETVDPTEEQIAFCRSAMHIAEGVVIEPLGLKIMGSGIDDAVWFKFRTGESDFSLIFDGSSVPSDSLAGTVSFYATDGLPEWWDTGSRTFTGGTVFLGGGVWMTAGFLREVDGTVCYIFWHET